MIVLKFLRKGIKMSNAKCDYCRKELPFKNPEIYINNLICFCDDECLIKYIKARFYDEDNNTWAI